MKLIVSSEVAAAYPALKIGVVIAKGVDNTGTDQALEDLKREKIIDFQKRWSKSAVKKHASIVAWRETYKSFGVDLGKFWPTSQKEAEMTLRDDPSAPRAYSKVVDAYLLAETRYFLPCGGYDLATIQGDIFLGYSPGGETFVPLGPGAPQATEPGEIIYRDSNRVLTRMWNAKDCDACKIVHESKDIALFTEAADPTIPDADLTGMNALIAELISRFCGGQVRQFIAETESELGEWSLE